MPPQAAALISRAAEKSFTFENRRTPECVHTPVYPCLILYSKKRILATFFTTIAN